MKISNRIKDGIYVVIDPSMEMVSLLNKLEKILLEEVVAVQVWDNFNSGQDIEVLLQKVCALCHAYNVPVLINNQLEYLLSTEIDGVHFDNIPSQLSHIREEVRRGFLCGLTCNNDLDPVHWAIDNGMDYISFCSVFPSATSNSCELVSFDTIREATKISPIPVFLAGGINPKNMDQLKELGYSGVAVISGVMNAEDPREAVKSYKEKFKSKS